MKRYFLGTLAIAIALTLASFTKSSLTEDLFVFEYSSPTPNDYAEGSVENESNTYWHYVGKNQDLCADNDTRACRVAVTEEYVDNASTPTELKDITITATEISGVAYVDGITNSPTNLFSNKQ